MNLEQIVDPLDEILFSTLWSALGQKSLNSMSIENLADAAGRTRTEVYARYSSSQAILLSALRALDEASLGKSAEDFADAPDASIHEKLLEGLISRFELYAPLRPQMQEVKQAAQLNPVLAARLLAQLADMTDRLLLLCGDNVVGWRRQARIKGVMAILLRAGTVWQSDDTADLSLTLRNLDKGLRQAAEWAVSFRVLDASELNAEAL